MVSAIVGLRCRGITEYLVPDRRTVTVGCLAVGPARDRREIKTERGVCAAAGATGVGFAEVGQRDDK